MILHELAGQRTPPWMEDAACRDATEDLFFYPEPPEHPGLSTQAQGGLAKSFISQWNNGLRAKIQFCSVCPVRDRCLKFGWDEEFGVYGGWSEAERQRIKDGTYRPAQVKAKISPKRDEAVALVREGLTTADAALKMGVGEGIVLGYLRQAWTLAVTESDIA